MSAQELEHIDVYAPTALAEDLAADYVTDAVWKNVTKRTASGRLVSAWSHIEYAVNRSAEISDIDRLESLDCARMLTQKILEKKHAAVNTHLSALVLASYLPTFSKRAYGLDLDNKDCADIYHSLAGAFVYTQPLRHGSIPSALSLETFVLALSARTKRPDYLLFPASPREESSIVQSVNHDSYFLTNGAKLPLQQKLITTSMEYSEDITTLTLLPLLEKANRRCGYHNDDDVADMLNLPIALIVAEASGEKLSKHEKALLDFLSEGVVAHYRQAIDGAESRPAA